MLKRGQVNPNRKSAHYVRQKPSRTRVDMCEHDIEGTCEKVNAYLGADRKKTGMDRDRIKAT